MPAPDTNAVGAAVQRISLLLDAIYEQYHRIERVRAYGDAEALSRALETLSFLRDELTLARKRVRTELNRPGEYVNNTDLNSKTS